MPNKELIKEIAGDLLNQYDPDEACDVAIEIAKLSVEFGDDDRLALWRGVHSECMMAVLNKPTGE